MLGRGCEICGVNSDIEYWFDVNKISDLDCNIRILCAVLVEYVRLSV